MYLHCSALESLEPLLRIYEGCARAYLGTIEDANVVKLHRFSGEVSYLAYPDFDTDPHPGPIELAGRGRGLEISGPIDAGAAQDVAIGDNQISGPGQPPATH